MVSPTDRTCPECGTTMQPTEKHEIVIDVCPECNGVYLDGGELQSIVDEVREERNEIKALFEDDHKHGKRKKKKSKSVEVLEGILSGLE
ncbi:MAG: zf-TFIIB domain-containing protein [Halobacteriaceae archaeon]